MRLLLDTHVILWWLEDDPALSWEVSIKQARGKLGPADLPERILATGLRELPITAMHAIAAGRLPMIHRDPFDRMLIAQAKAEGLTLATRDEYIVKYDVALLHV